MNRDFSSSDPFGIICYEFEDGFVSLIDSLHFLISPSGLGPYLQAAELWSHCRDIVVPGVAETLILHHHYIEHYGEVDRPHW